MYKLETISSFSGCIFDKFVKLNGYNFPFDGICWDLSNLLRIDNKWVDVKPQVASMPKAMLKQKGFSEMISNKDMHYDKIRMTLYYCNMLSGSTGLNFRNLRCKERS